MTKIECSLIVPGVRFSKPVFFDDGQNMFLCADHPAKSYHVAAIKRWSIPYLLTDGKMLSPVKVKEEKAVPVSAGEVEELAELDELEEI